MMRLILVCLISSVFSVSGASAQGFVDEARVGLYAQSCCGFGSSKEDGVAINAELLFPSPRFLSVLGAPRPLIGGTLATDSGATDQVYTGLEWKLNVTPKWFVAVSPGITIHNGETDTFNPVTDAARAATTVFYGCRALFRIAGDVGYRLTDRLSASFHWNHISNAGLCTDNEGLDQIGARLGVSF
ncbi:acyloxyacyl hydrolase [Hyphococcus flavus]|uniref:Acyloxyacyl hydrolase n=1 Tax=Hyphococcus flavus TaxID=1866326 RepID=A0AAF0CC84_9PROT|nr:acyloxyacyl hydrolase [Hyphococcus flavus]WDI32860.1 acyloxyacyl hydrolase [Hyphococcus flavus]